MPATIESREIASNRRSVVLYSRLIAAAVYDSPTFTGDALACYVQLHYMWHLPTE